MESTSTETRSQDKDISNDRVRRMTRDEIMAVFERYDFKDEHGNPLVYCQDFIELLDLVFPPPSEATNWPAPSGGTNRPW